MFIQPPPSLRDTESIKEVSRQPRAAPWGPTGKGGAFRFPDWAQGPLDWPKPVGGSRSQGEHEAGAALGRRAARWDGEAGVRTEARAGHAAGGGKYGRRSGALGEQRDRRSSGGNRRLALEAGGGVVATFPRETEGEATMAERPEDLNLPNAVITRIIKEALPDGVNISKEARSAISRAASVFVLYATSCANNFAMKGKRKTLNAGDVLSAMEEMEFQRFISPLKEALDAYRREQKGKKEASEQKKKDKDKRTDSEEQDKSREDDNEDYDERMEEEEQNDEEEVDN